MTKQEAKAKLKDCRESGWAIKEISPGDYQLVKVSLSIPADSTRKTRTQPEEVQAIKEDPRNVFEQNVPPNGVGLI